MPENIEESVDTTLLNVNEDVEELVKEIIAKHNYSSKCKVIYSAGSDVGDNYASKTIAVDIKDDKESLSLFLKYAHSVETASMPLDKVYANEIYFYDKIVPTLTKFAEDRGIKNILRNIPKCVGTSIKHVIALDNLKKVGYRLFDRKGIMSECHIVLVLKAFAKYHGLCFAYKDQKRKHFRQMTSEVHDLLDVYTAADNPFQAIQEKMLNAFLEQLDPVTDKRIIDKQEVIRQRTNFYAADMEKMPSDNAVIAKGDCWSNNIMFLYNDKNTEDPTDVMLIDWQMLCIKSVVIDLSYFFYTVACDGELDRLEYYQKVYHAELSKCMKDLGSDPDVVYPYSVFKQEWKNYCISGYATSILVLKIMLLDKEDAPELGDPEKTEFTEQFAQLKTSPEYIRRLKKITEHFIENDFF